MALSFTELELRAITAYIPGIGILDGTYDLDPMTFIYDPDPYCLEIYLMCSRYDFLRRGFWKLLFEFDRHKTYIQTESTKIIKHAASRVLNNSLIQSKFVTTDLIMTDLTSIANHIHKLNKSCCYRSIHLYYVHETNSTADYVTSTLQSSVSAIFTLKQTSSSSSSS